MQAQCWICPVCADDVPHWPGNARCAENAGRIHKLLAQYEDLSRIISPEDVERPDPGTFEVRLRQIVNVKGAD